MVVEEEEKWGLELAGGEKGTMELYKRLGKVLKVTLNMQLCNYACVSMSLHINRLLYEE